MTTPDQLDAKRRRVSRACDICRRKKVRCDGLQPSCTNCTTFGFQCTFNDSAKKRGPPKGYIEALENRLHRMESLLGGLVQSGERPKADLDAWRDEHDDDVDSLDSIWPASSDTPLFPPPVPSSLPTNNRHQHTDSISTAISSSSTINSQMNEEEEEEVLPFDLEAREKINAISDSLSSMTLDDGGFVRYLGNSSGIDMLQRSQLLKNGRYMMPLRMNEHREWLLQRENIIAQMESEMTMPPRDLAEHLIELYFTYVHPNIPVLHRPTFMRQYRNLDPLKKPPRALLNAMFAIASRYSTNPEIIGNDPEAFGDEYFSRAKRLIDLEYEVPRQTSIQALLLMVTYRFTSAKSGGRVWVMLGMATRMAQDLGMHRNSARWHLPPLEAELRKRLWWAVYVMDRWVSACMGRPMAIDDADCDVDYPSVVEQDWADPDGNPVSPSEEAEKLKEQSSFALRYFVETIKLSQILGQILRGVYSPQTRNHGPGQVISTVYDLDTMLTKWLLALPSDLKYDNKIEPMQLSRWVATIHISYYSALILLHRPYMVPSSLTRSKLSESMPSLNICISAANSITHLAEMLVHEDFLKYVWNFSTFDIFLASLIHLTNSASLDIFLQKQARKNLVKTIAYMKNLGSRWFNAAKFSMLLEDLMNAHLNFDEYKMDDHAFESEVAAKAGQIDCPYPIMLRDQTHPSGGTLMFSPKVVGGPQTPLSASSTPSSSPSTPLIVNPDIVQNSKSGFTGQDNSNFQNVQNSPISDANMPATHGSVNAAAQTAAKPKRSRKGTSSSQRNSLLFQGNTPSSSSIDQPTFTFSSLSIPGMFTHGQAFVDYRQIMNQQQPPHPSPSQIQSTQQQQQQQQQQHQEQQLHESQLAQPFSLTPLFSSPLALQERCTQHQQTLNNDQNHPVDPIQHLQLQRQQQFLQHQHEFIQQQQFIQQHRLNMRLQEQQKQAQGMPQQPEQQQYKACDDISDNKNFVSSPVFNASETRSQEGSSSAISSSYDKAGNNTNTTTTSTSANTVGATESYSNLALFSPQELIQDPNMVAVPNPFFGIPNTINWDEWNQFIANTTLQKF
ncbi:hypothetical protein BX616_010512 [Lobosporangium transversale]|uniref:Fungal-specific transcription factor domain-domain-containing protein n=1 Tax=Lobosporangium transversale TaxID=64571 RepID=A0A1Y2GG38_9FUNG|nr:fungal-specific transcription factor domain-domain-containing protein [Lobosporangium transversale]KAF9918041.1 hypothetical protein BX616_010512 [Lobosporangium transversale]ORZ09778.1 fungal-specific transcription factor domain-domain-containing protein [Lobosporangium transversale]|eukprot:XP_021879048.1 fungal-specific transcription factor domain-domain-containing protein [Lobosporangium transversale]